MKPGQRAARDTVLPDLRLDLTQSAPADLTALFAASVGAVRLEIGFGGGEHLLDSARREPATGFIGVEPFENSLLAAVSEIARDGLGNIRIFDDDAGPLLDWLPPESIERVDLLFPDPWPKTRHRKRRFVNDPNLHRIARVLAPDGTFRFASDVDAYCRWTLREAKRNGRLVWTGASLEACRTPWPGWPGTRYQAKALAAGRAPAYLTFVHVPKPSSAGDIVTMRPNPATR